MRTNAFGANDLTFSSADADGVPNEDAGGTFNNSGGPYMSYYNTAGLGTCTFYGNNDNRATDPTVAAVTQICASDAATNPGYSSPTNPARSGSAGCTVGYFGLPTSARNVAAVPTPYTRWALRSLPNVGRSYCQIGL